MPNSGIRKVKDRHIDLHNHINCIPTFLLETREIMVLTMGSLCVKIILSNRVFLGVFVLMQQARSLKSQGDSFCAEIESHNPRAHILEYILMEEHNVMERKKKVFSLTCLICLILMGALLVMQFLPYWTIEKSEMAQLNYPMEEDYKISMWRYVTFPLDYPAVTEYFEKCYKDYSREYFDKNVKPVYDKQFRAYYNDHIDQYSDDRVREYIDAELKSFYYQNNLDRFYAEQFKDFLRERFEENKDADFKKVLKNYSEEELAELYEVCFAQHSEEYFEKYSEDYYNIYFETDMIVNEKGYLIDSMIIIPWGVLLCLIFGIVCYVMGMEFGVPCLSVICGVIGVSKYVSAYRTIGILTMSNVWWLHLAIFAVILVIGIWMVYEYITTRYIFRKR